MRTWFRSQAAHGQPAVAPGVGVFGFVPLPGRVMAAILGSVGLYLLATEMAKRRFYRHPVLRSMKAAVSSR